MTIYDSNAKWIPQCKTCKYDCTTVRVQGHRVRARPKNAVKSGKRNVNSVTFQVGL